MKNVSFCLVFFMLTTAAIWSETKPANRINAMLVEVHEILDSENGSNKNFALETISWCIETLSTENLSSEELADGYYILALMYDSLIHDSVSWLSYNVDQQKYLKLSLAFDPEHVDARLLSVKTLLALPGSAGGDPELGRTLLSALHTEHPDDIRVKLTLVQDLLGLNELVLAKSLLSEAIMLNPDHIVTNRLLRQTEIVEQELVIRRFMLAGNLKTSENRLLRKLSPFIGTTYTFYTHNEIAERLEQIRSIRGSSVTAEEAGEDEVDLTVRVREDNMIMLGAMGLFSLSLDYNKKAIPSGNPVLLYTDQNFLGSADRVRLIYAGPYINLNYRRDGLIDDRFPDIRLNWESMFLAIDDSTIKDGQIQEDEVIKSPFHSISLGVGKGFSFGLSAFFDMKIAYESWKPDPERTADDFFPPSYNIKYQPSFEFLFSTMTEGTGSGLKIPTGFYVQLLPSLMYIPDYSPWGMNGDLHVHDSKPQWTFSATAGYSRTIFAGHTLQLDAVHMTGGNFYTNNHWTAGKGTPTSSGLSLDGFYTSEFAFAKGLLGNVTYHMAIIPTKFSSLVRYAFLYHYDTRETYHGSAFGISGKLPFNMEFSAQLGIGINATRQSGLGYEFDFTLSRLWFL